MVSYRTKCIHEHRITREINFNSKNSKTFFLVFAIFSIFFFVIFVFLFFLYFYQKKFRSKGTLRSLDNDEGVYLQFGLALLQDEGQI